jgi:hypothetical protein
MLLGAVVALAALATHPVAAQSAADDPCVEPALSEKQAAFAKEAGSPPSTPVSGTRTAALTSPLVQQLIVARFPELTRKQIRVRTFNSDYDFFRTRFSYSRFFLFRRIRYFVEVNPRLLSLSPPPDGVCAILGHELTHISSMSHGNRLRLFGLIRLASGKYTSAFERRADLEAIHRGFAPGLKDYRHWIYANIPAEKVARKKRDYFTPEEIDALLSRLKQDPSLMDYWMHHVPLNAQQIVAVPGSGNFGKCRSSE